MRKNGCDFLRLDTCQLPHQIIEKILINVAAKNGVSWKELIGVDYYNTELVAEACVAAILIEKYISPAFDDERRSNYALSGFRYYDIVEDYFKAIK